MNNDNENKVQSGTKRDNIIEFYWNRNFDAPQIIIHQEQFTTIINEIIDELAHNNVLETLHSDKLLVIVDKQNESLLISNQVFRNFFEIGIYLQKSPELSLNDVNIRTLHQYYQILRTEFARDSLNRLDAFTKIGNF